MELQSNPLASFILDLIFPCFSCLEKEWKVGEKQVLGRQDPRHRNEYRQPARLQTQCFSLDVDKS